VHRSLHNMVRSHEEFVIELQAAIRREHKCAAAMQRQEHPQPLSSQTTRLMLETLAPPPAQ